MPFLPYLSRYLAGLLCAHYTLQCLIHRVLNRAFKRTRANNARSFEVAKSHPQLFALMYDRRTNDSDLVLSSNDLEKEEQDSLQSHQLTYW